MAADQQRGCGLFQYLSNRWPARDVRPGNVRPVVQHEQIAALVHQRGQCNVVVALSAMPHALGRADDPAQPADAKPINLDSRTIQQMGLFVAQDFTCRRARSDWPQAIVVARDSDNPAANASERAPHLKHVILSRPRVKVAGEDDTRSIRRRQRAVSLQPRDCDGHHLCQSHQRLAGVGETLKVRRCDNCVEQMWQSIDEGTEERQFTAWRVLRR